MIGLRRGQRQPVKYFDLAPSCLSEGSISNHQGARSAGPMLPSVMALGCSLRWSKQGLIGWFMGLLQTFPSSYREGVLFGNWG